MGEGDSVTRLQSLKDAKLRAEENMDLETNGENVEQTGKEKIEESITEEDESAKRDEKDDKRKSNNRLSLELSSLVQEENLPAEVEEKVLSETKSEADVQ